MKAPRTPAYNSPMNTKRERANGQYTHNTMEALCVCGHPLGIHLAEGPRECGCHEAHLINPRVYPVELPPCACLKFRKARTAKA